MITLRRNPINLWNVYRRAGSVSLPSLVSVLEQIEFG